MGARGALLGVLGALLDALGALLDTLGAPLGRSWDAFGALGSLLDASWMRLAEKPRCDQFVGGQLGSQNPPKLPPKSLKNRCEKGNKF